MLNEKFWLAIAFLSFCALIIKYVGPSIAKALDNKSKKIAEDILAAKELKEKAEKLLAKAEKYLEESSSFAEKLMKDAEIEAKNFAEDSRLALESELSKKTAAALERIKLEEQVATREIKTKIVTLALESMSKGLNLDQKNHEDLINKATKDFEKILN